MRYTQAILWALLSISAMPGWADGHKVRQKKEQSIIEKRDASTKNEAEQIASSPITNDVSALLESAFLSRLEFYIEDHRQTDPQHTLDSVYKILKERRKLLLRQPNQERADVPVQQMGAGLAQEEADVVKQKVLADSLIVLRRYLEEMHNAQAEAREQYETTLLRLINSYRSMMCKPERITPDLEKAEREVRPQFLEACRKQIELLRHYPKYNEELVQILQAYEFNQSRLDRVPTSEKKKLIEATIQALKSTEYYLKSKGTDDEIFYLSDRYDEALRLLELQENFRNIVISFEPLLQVL